MSEQTATRKPCDCGERDHLESELEKTRDLVCELDISGERTDEALRSARARIAQLEAALRLIAAGSPPDDWKWKDEHGWFLGHGQRGEQDFVEEPAKIDPDEMHLHGIAVGAWMAARIALKALAQEGK